MVVVGILLMVLGALSLGVLDNSMEVGNQVWDMDLVGGILLGLGALSLLMGLIYVYVGANTSHRAYEEHDVIVDEVPEEKPVVIKRRKPRTPKKGN